MKTFKRIFFYVTVVFSVLLIALVAAVFLFKDRIINEFIKAANNHLNTPVKVGKFDVSVFQDFPKLSIVLTDVYVEDSHEGNYPLLTAKKIFFQINPLDAWAGDYSIDGVIIENSETNLKINAKGKNNYTVTKPTNSAGGGDVSFALKDIELINCRVRYVDIKANENLEFFTEMLLASIHSTNHVYDIKAEGQLTTEKLNVNGNSIINGKTFKIKSDLVYDDEQKIFSINPSTLKLKNSAFKVSGNYSWKNKNLIDIKTEGDDADIQTLLSLLPEGVAKKLEKYKSKGDVYFKAHLKGEISNKKDPSVSVDFGFTNTTIFNPELKSEIENASLTGSFASAEILKPSTASLVLKNIRGTLNDEPFSSNLIIHNFNNPNVIFDFKGRIDAASLLGFYPIENVREVSGGVLADIAFEGQIELLKKKSTAQRVFTRGSIDLQNINLTYGDKRIPLDNLNGSLQFSNNDLALSNVSCKLGKSDFMLNGFFKNIITFLLFENQPIGIETDLKSDYLDLDQLLALGYGKPSEGPKQEYEFSISKNVYLNFNCDVKALKYRRFYAQQIKGDMLVKNQVAVSRNLAFKTMGGSVTLSGIIDAVNNRAIDVVCSSKVNNIYVDSAFSVFENFNQNFIRDKHLKGLGTADVSLEMSLNQNLKIFPETLIADINIAIKRGELNNFEPMQKLNRFVDDESLNKLRFSELRNEIHIENKTVYIPQMEVKSNVTDIRISGTHTFDQHIDYHLVTPLRSKKKLNGDVNESAFEVDGSGQTKLFLKIIGTTENYRIAYDTDAVKKKIVSDLKREVKELKDAFKKKDTQKKKEVELEKDEYFDW